MKAWPALLALLALLAGCGGTVAGPRAQVLADATSLDATSLDATSLDAGCSSHEGYGFSNDGSRIEVVGAALGKTDRIVVRRFSGQLLRRDGGVTLTLEADMRSMQADDPDVDAFIKSPGYFDVERLPDMRFTSTEVSRPGADGAHVVRGNLLLHGVTKTIAFPAELRIDNERLTLQSQFVVDRHDFDIRASALKDVVISNDLLIEVTLDATLSTSHRCHGAEDAR